MDDNILIFLSDGWRGQTAVLTFGGTGDDDHDDGGEVERREHVVQLRGLLHADTQQDWKETAQSYTLEKNIEGGVSLW